MASRVLCMQDQWAPVDSTGAAIMGWADTGPDDLDSRERELDG